MSIGLINLEKREEGTELKDKINLEDIGDLYEMNKQEPSQRSLSVLLYLTLTHFGVSWRKTEEFMQRIGGMSPQTCHKWAETFIEEDYDDFVEENRGASMEIRATRKNASFTSLELARYLDDQYYELTGEVKATDQLIRSERLCRLDLRRYG
ncbi:unnamed protein product, partial [Didymodactylos carnosus]